VELYLYPFLSSTLDVGGERYSVSIVQEDRWVSQSVWTARKIWLPAGFEPQNAQPVASPYSDYAIQAPKISGLTYVNALCFSNLTSARTSVCW
jgi:hypothetical protein